MPVRARGVARALSAVLTRRRAFATAVAAVAVAAGGFSPQPAAAVAAVVARCPGDGQTPSASNHSATAPFAATFVPDRTGKLSAVSITISHESEPQEGYVLKVVKVGADGLPKTGRPLAKKSIPYEKVEKVGFVTLTAKFPKKRAITLEQGKAYAVVVSRPKGSNATFRMKGLLNNPCADSTAFSLVPGFGYQASPTIDFEFEVVVGYDRP